MTNDVLPFFEEPAQGLDGNIGIFEQGNMCGTNPITLIGDCRVRLKLF